MTLEFALLLFTTAFVLSGFFGNNGVQNVFKSSGPRLGARIERNTATGVGFGQAIGRTWKIDDSKAAPTGKIGP